MDAAMAATIALKEQTKNRMNFETGYLFCHVETKKAPRNVSFRVLFLGGRGWITQAAHLKKPRSGFFPRRTIRRVDAVRIHPLGEINFVI